MRLFTAFIFCLVFAACSGDPAGGRADYELALKYLNGAMGVEVDAAKGVSLLQKAAAEGNADAQLTLGYCYLKGDNGLPRDEKKGVELFQKAAESGNRDAQYNIGLAYVRGQGVKADFAQAFEWFQKAAYQGDVGAQYNVGVMYANGEGSAVDPLSAYIWFRIANEKGYDGASEGMNSAKNDMTADQQKQIDAEYQRILKLIKEPIVPPSMKINSNVPL